ncbi:sigma-54-dependent transcriptional regulator [Trichloromonas sp.]|uniref:sigma-54-dependent transcriptional regulator n=1 Tax=Trichloromonas sp. TaxID=3069249 RepID=UPI002A3B610F|nr:sigma-54 dependent transcriptional regulator [Trichloromonas sp.]
MKPILIIDDEASMRHMLRLVLEKQGYAVIEAENGVAALTAVAGQECLLALCDIRMPDMDGLAFLRTLRAKHIHLTVIMMSAYGSVDTALECMKQGAYDYISKPFKPDEVVLAVKKAEERLGLQQENARLKQALAGERRGREPIYTSEAMAAVMARVAALAAVTSPVLITGETGTGKELVARALHEQGNRHDAPFVAVNCSAIAAGLLESELFGHAKGAFTGADRERQGLFGAAHGGTLFLDEIGELPSELQPKLLRVLQEGEVLRVGDSKPRKVDVRVLAATARDLRQEVAVGRFREDLYFRLAVVDVHIPPLRERKKDIAVLAEHFLAAAARREGRPVPHLTADAVAALENYGWPGNVRELENLMEKTLIFCRGEWVNQVALPWEVRRRERDRAEDYSLKQAVARLEKEYIRKALAATGGNQTKAARLLEISLRALVYKLKEMGED